MIGSFKQVQQYVMCCFISKKIHLKNYILILSILKTRRADNYFSSLVNEKRNHLCKLRIKSEIEWLYFVLK